MKTVPIFLPVETTRFVLIELPNIIESGSFGGKTCFVCIKARRVVALKYIFVQIGLYE